MSNESSAVTQAERAKASALLDDLLTLVISGGDGIETLLSQVGEAALRVATIDRLLRPELAGYTLPFTQAVFRRIPLGDIRPRVEQLICDRTLPRHVRARMADLLATKDLDGMWALVDGPLADEEDADTLYFEGHQERELTLLTGGLRQPADIAGLLAAIPDDWIEIAAESLERVRQRLDVPAPRVYEAVLATPELSAVWPGALTALVTDGSAAAQQVIDRARQASTGTERAAVLEEAWSRIVIARAQQTTEPAPTGEAYMTGVDAGGRAWGLLCVTIGAGGESRFITLDFNGGGVEIGAKRPFTPDVTQAFVRRERSWVKASFDDVLALASLLSAEALTGESAPERAAFAAVLRRASPLEPLAPGEPLDEEEAHALLSEGALRDWQIQSGDLLALLGELGAVEEGGDEEDEALDPEQARLRYARRLTYAAYHQQWSGDPALGGRLLATAQELRAGPNAFLIGLLRRETERLQPSLTQ